MTDTEALFRGDVAGDSLRTIGRRHGVAPETVRRIVSKRGAELIADLEYDLRHARRREAEGQLDVEWPTYVIWADQGQQDVQDAVALLRWTVRELRGRGLPIEVETRQTSTGVAFMLTLPHGVNP